MVATRYDVAKGFVVKKKEEDMTQENQAQALTVSRAAEVGIVLPPEAVLENAMVAAKALTRVLSLKKNPVIMNGEQYLEYEDWMTCGEFFGYGVRTGDAMAVEIDGVKGAKARADLIHLKTGMLLGGAEAYCMRDEEHWNTRPKYEWQGEGDNRKRFKVGDDIVPWFQLASMAQTRAGAKAFRNRLAWVVVLAGYRPTPAEEMTEGTVSEMVKERRTVDKSSHYCPVHDVNFFKSGRMKNYAHPVEGTKEWCNEPDETPEPASQPAKSTASPTEEKTEGKPPDKVKKGKRDTKSLKTIEQLAHALRDDFGLSYAEQWKELNISDWNGLAVTPAEAYIQIASAKE